MAGKIKTGGEVARPERPRLEAREVKSGMDTLRNNFPKR